MPYSQLHQELDMVTRKQWEPDRGEDPFCCTPTRHNVISAIRAAFELEPLGEQEIANPVQALFQERKTDGT
jgi:hypothetical protein